MPRDAVSRTANVGTVGKNGLTRFRKDFSVCVINFYVIQAENFSILSSSLIYYVSSIYHEERIVTGGQYEGINIVWYSSWFLYWKPYIFNQYKNQLEYQTIFIRSLYNLQFVIRNLNHKTNLCSLTPFTWALSTDEALQSTSAFAFWDISYIRRGRELNLAARCTLMSLLFVAYPLPWVRENLAIFCLKMTSWNYSVLSQSNDIFSLVI